MRFLFMFAKVNGPYTRKNGYKAVVIVHYDENGKFVKQEYIGYQKYLKDYDEGKHRYVRAYYEGSGFLAVRLRKQLCARPKWTK